MWPWGHLAVGYLLYSGYARWRLGEPPRAEATMVVVFGTLLPDLVDKPLAWTFGVLPTGRTLAHSVVIALPILVALYLWLRRSEHGQLVVALGIGWLSHSVSDLPPEVLFGAYADASYLLWPILPSPTYETSPSFLAHLMALRIDGFQLLQLGLFLLASIVWYVDGTPGWGWWYSKLVDR